MSLEILRDERVRSVPWRDLVPLTRLEIAKQLMLPLPWLASSLFLAGYGMFAAALGFSFVFFLTGLRVVHDAYHDALGLPRAATHLVMFGLSALMLGSMHAVRITHLHHHKHCMDDQDVEAASALLPWWKALLVGPIFPFRIHLLGIRIARNAERRWIAAELATTALLVAGALLTLPSSILVYQVVAMCAGHSLTSFFAVWTVHHDCDRSHYIARTLRNRVKSLIAFEMFYHVEHHLFPRVPTCHLAPLAARLDQAAPELCSRQVY